MATFKPRAVHKNKMNPHPIHSATKTDDEIRDALLHVKWNLEKSGWTTEDFMSLLSIARTTWYKYAHKPTSKGYRRIPAEKLDLLRIEDALNTARQPDLCYAPSFMPKRNEWAVGDQTTHSYMAAVYISGTTGEPIIAGGDNVPADATLIESTAHIRRWFDVKRSATRQQIMAVTGLSDYDIGRLGFVSSRWGLEINS